MIYDLLAPYYDEFIDGVDYNAYASFIEGCFDRYLKKRPELVLDLCCGTGVLTTALAERGYDMTGVDRSSEMLLLARARAQGAGLGDKILYLEQDACELELYGTVGACICTLDGINHIILHSEMIKVLSLVHNYLDPDGLFIFDINGKGKFEGALSGRSYVYERGDDMCVWQSAYNERTRLCDFYITLFAAQDDGSFIRYDDCQRQRMRTIRQMKRALLCCGFEFIGAFCDYDFNDADDDSSRIYIVARCKK